MFAVQSGTAAVHGADSVLPLPTLHRATQYKQIICAATSFAFLKNFIDFTHLKMQRQYKAAVAALGINEHKEFDWCKNFIHLSSTATLKKGKKSQKAK